ARGNADYEGDPAPMCDVNVQPALETEVRVLLDPLPSPHEETTEAGNAARRERSRHLSGRSPEFRETHLSEFEDTLSVGRLCLSPSSPHFPLRNRIPRIRRCEMQ